MGDLSLSEPPVIHRGDTWCPGPQMLCSVGIRVPRLGSGEWWQDSNFPDYLCGYTFLHRNETCHGWELVLVCACFARRDSLQCILH